METTYAPFLIFRATYADNSYWTTDGRSELLNFDSMPLGAVSAAIKKRLAEIASALDKVKAKTAPVSCRINGHIVAHYQDGRQAIESFGVDQETLEQLADAVLAWSEEALKKLESIGSDDV